MSKWEAIWSSGIRIVWRSLLWKEFQDLQVRPFMCPMDRYLEVYRICVLEGPHPEQASFGTVTWLGTREMEQSPFSGRYEPIAHALADKRAKIAGNYLFAGAGLIAAALHVPFDAIAGWDADEFFDHLAQAEFIAGKPLEPTNPNAKPGDNNRPRVKGGKRLVRPEPPGGRPSWNPEPVRKEGPTTEQETFTWTK